jgi:hypothetical protein
MACACHPSCSKRRITGQAGLGIKRDPISKVTKAKQAVHLGQMAELFLASVRPYVQPPSTVKKKENHNCNKTDETIKAGDCEKGRAQPMSPRLVYYSDRRKDG